MLIRGFIGSINQEQSLDWVSVSHTYNPMYLGSRNKEDHSKKFMRPHLNQYLSYLAHTCLNRECGKG
jgi:hypothetical protein